MERKGLEPVFGNEVSACLDLILNYADDHVRYGSGGVPVRHGTVGM